MKGKYWSVAILGVAASLFVPYAAAHTFGAHGAGFVSGVAHPLTGLDHMLAMIAVGLWAAQLGGRAYWSVPLAFVGMMVLGAVMSTAGLPLPAVESGIAASVLILGLLIAFSARMPVTLGMVLVGVFALFHGHAHGTELPQAASAASYGLGMLLATVGLHATGLGAGILFQRAAVLLRIGGAMIAAAGAMMWVGM
jgi:urease accessory protein